MMLMPCGPSAVPTGGAGLAFPAGIWSFTKPDTFFATLPPVRMPKVVASGRTATLSFSSLWSATRARGPVVGNGWWVLSDGVRRHSPLTTHHELRFSVPLQLQVIEL